MNAPQPRNDLAKQQTQQNKPAPAKPANMEAASDLEKMFSSEKVQQRFRDIAAKHIDAQKLIRVALMARSRNAQLGTCTGESFLRCVLECAELGLEPSGTYGGAHLVPRWNKHISRNECTLVIDYRGLVDLARRSGRIEAVESDVVYENDYFAYARGLKPQLEHKPALVGDRGVPVGAWACVYYKGGRTTFEVMRADEIEGIKLRNPKWESGPWKTDPGQMWKKTVVKRALNMAPKSKRMERALAVDAEAERDITPVTEVPALPSATHAAVLDFGDEVKKSKAMRLAEELKRPAPQAKEPALPESEVFQDVLEGSGWIEAVDSASPGPEADKLAEEIRAIPDESKRQHLMQRLASKLTPPEPGAEG